MPNLPIRNKEALIRELAGSQLREDYICYFSQSESLTLAILTRAVNVVSEIATVEPQKPFAE
ncbi:hypothetical protein FHQ28_02380 [Pasteurellaceae bacterium USgator11]|nr:hypothetical protein FHQ19_07090 [Pasteurellaceae bacterium UScroc12]TNG97954.1 hypothetical protein FHQ20_01740 [Pasteurellaceae bacterium USgator41]TNG99281.1 hypothetical protein FHQ24_06315 [Pasteurellaceae bacterium UScroc31]TNH02696.1 hypothetical protein FHQ28_02380 [Pasteurellaceae bacterium USgator11]